MSNNSSSKLDFLAIGDITGDAFITVNDVRIDTEPHPGDNGLQEICFRFGDKIPYEKVDVINAVGNSPNAAVSAHRLGLKSGLYSELGDDRNGQEYMMTLQQEGLETKYLHINEGMPSNFHFVLQFGPERTILIKHEEYEYTLPEFDEAPQWMYLSSLGESSLELHHEIAKFVNEHDTKLAFQPGTFQMKLGKEALADIYQATEIFFCNKEEAERILGVGTTDIKELLRSIHGLGPKIVAITDGPLGAYASDGTDMWFMPPYPDPKPPVSRTGAGDAFASTFTSAIILGNDIPTALSWGPINSMAVVQKIGAQTGLLPREELEKLLKEAPESYKAQKL